jgi:hypothetical protein
VIPQTDAVPLCWREPFRASGCGDVDCSITFAAELRAGFLGRRTHRFGSNKPTLSVPI